MECEIDYDLDAGGDVLLVLQNPNEPFAVWAAEEDWELSRPKLLETDKGSDYIIEDPAYRIGCLLGTTEPEPDPPEQAEHRKKKRKRSRARVVGERPEVRFRLSSRHLILASPYFKAMLTGPWAENSSRTGSTYTAHASDWDEEALAILMDIIHGHSERVPRSMSLELLAKMAVVVDYYQCHKIVKFYSDTWIGGRLGPDKNNLRPKASRDFVLWLCISYVFAQKDIFYTLTYHAVRKTRGPLRTLGLPFPHGLIEKIDDIRMSAVEVILNHYHDLVWYLGTRDFCSEYQCSSVLLGQLVREMMAQGIFSPRPTRPLLGFNVKEAIQMTLDIESLNWNRLGSSPSHDCSLNRFLKNYMLNVQAHVKGLNLDDFIGRR